MAGGRNGFRVHLTVLTSTAHGTAAANNFTRAPRPLTYQKPDATKTAWLLFKNQTKPMFLSLGWEGSRWGAERAWDHPRIAARPVLGLGEKMSKTQSIWHLPALGLPELYPVPAWTKCEMKPVAVTEEETDTHRTKKRQGYNEMKFQT